MSSKALFYALLLVGTGLEIIGDILFKRWGAEGRPGLLAWGLAIYMAGAALWACSLRYAPLATAAALFAVINVLILSLGGLILFQERLGPGHVVGIGLGLLSVAMLAEVD
ncbi:MAG: SMR family transporter [Actinomycetota bacterium]